MRLQQLAEGVNQFRFIGRCWALGGRPEGGRFPSGHHEAAYSSGAAPRPIQYVSCRGAGGACLGAITSQSDQPEG
jgi:hypothetical protein